MSPLPLQPYTKPALSYDEQVAKLSGRGLMVANPKAAADFLAHINYYRFSGYCLPFEVARHQFVPGTTFEQVVALHDFDRVLRDLFSEALEVVEVDLRSAMAYFFGHGHGAFGHTTPTVFYYGFKHAEWIAKVREEAERSSELFIEHHRHTYAEFPDLPIWIATEVMSFGALSRMYQGMVREDQIGLAKRYGLHSTVMQSWLHHLVYMRNLCAHHLRLWGKVSSIIPDLPRNVPAWGTTYVPRRDCLFCTLLILNTLMTRSAAVKPFAKEWRGRVIAHLAQPPAGLNLMAGLGAPANWASHPLWK